MNSSAWDKFRKQQATEREQLRRLLAGVHELLEKCHNSPPTEVELLALAATLHSFYTGAENIFKRLALDLDGERATGEAWHSDLLRRMKSSTANHSPLLSAELHDSLNEYLRFRHVFRNAYSFNLDWRKISPLALRLEETFSLLEKQLDEFLRSGPT